MPEYFTTHPEIILNDYSVAGILRLFKYNYMTKHCDSYTFINQLYIYIPVHDHE